MGKGSDEKRNDIRIVNSWDLQFSNPNDLEALYTQLRSIANLLKKKPEMKALFGDETTNAIKDIAERRFEDDFQKVLTREDETAQGMKIYLAYTLTYVNNQLWQMQDVLDEHKEEAYSEISTAVYSALTVMNRICSKKRDYAPLDIEKAGTSISAADLSPFLDGLKSLQELLNDEEIRERIADKKDMSENGPWPTELTYEKMNALMKELSNLQREAFPEGGAVNEEKRKEFVSFINETAQRMYSYREYVENLESEFGDSEGNWYQGPIEALNTICTRFSELQENYPDPKRVEEDKVLKERRKFNTEEQYTRPAKTWNGKNNYDPIQTPFYSFHFAAAMATIGLHELAEEDNIYPLGSDLQILMKYSDDLADAEHVFYKENEDVAKLADKVAAIDLLAKIHEQLSVHVGKIEEMVKAPYQHGLSNPRKLHDVKFFLGYVDMMKRMYEKILADKELAQDIEDARKRVELQNKKLQNKKLQQDSDINENNIIDTSRKDNKGPKNDGSQPLQGNREEQLKNAIREIREKFKKRAKDLEKAKSPWKNSQEYQDLIDEVKAIGERSGDETSIFPGYENLNMTPEEHFAQELYRIHELTEKYLEHKAKDGVNKNAYMKLCLVEETSKLIRDALDITGDQDLLYNTKLRINDKKNEYTELPVTTKALGLSLEQCRDSVPEAVKNQVKRLSDASCTSTSLLYLDRNPEKKQTLGEENIKRVVRDVDDCMGKILLKAVNKGPEQIDKSMIRALTDMRTNFRENPFPKMEKELTQAIRKESPVVQGPAR